MGDAPSVTIASTIRCIALFARFDLSRDILESYALTSPNSLTRCLDAPQELWMVFEPVFKPIILRPEANQDTCGAPMPRDNDLLISSLPEIAGKVILDLRKSYLTRLVHPLARASPRLPASG